MPIVSFVFHIFDNCPKMHCHQHKLVTFAPCKAWDFLPQFGHNFISSVTFPLPYLSFNSEMGFFGLAVLPAGLRLWKWTFLHGQAKLTLQSCQFPAFPRKNFKLLALNVVTVSKRWLLTRGSKYSDLTWKLLVFGSFF